MKSGFLLLLTLVFSGFACIGANKNENIEFSENACISADVYMVTGEEKTAFTGFYPDSLRGLGSDVYIRFMKNTDTLPGNFIRECIGDGVCPYLIIEGDKNIFDLGLIEKIAENLGYYSTKAYIELYPIYAAPSFNTDSYRWFYKEAVRIFKKYAPETEIVWALSSEYIYEEGEWLPFGAEIDFLGISVVLGLNGENNAPELWDRLEYLTFTYDLPLIITRFGVTDYSEKNHRYYKNEKLPYITEGLKNLTSAYPNIGGILLFELEDYEYEGCENKLRFSNSDEAVRLVVKYINEFKEGQGLKKLSYTLLIGGSSAYMPYEDFRGNFGGEYTAVYIDGEKYINLSRYFTESGLGEIFVSEKNRAVILPEKSV